MDTETNFQERPQQAVDRTRSTYGYTAVRFAALVTVPILVGLTMALRWPRASDNFYSAVAGVIGSLFIAIAIKFVGSDVAWRGRLDQLQTMSLVALSWAGLFACLRALAGGKSTLTIAFAGAGLTASSEVFSLMLYETLRGDRAASNRGDLVVIVLLLIPILVLTTF